jgi:hypothetical protein
VLNHTHVHSEVRPSSDCNLASLITKGLTRATMHHSKYDVAQGSPPIIIAAAWELALDSCSIQTGVWSYRIVQESCVCVAFSLKKAAAYKCVHKLVLKVPYHIVSLFRSLFMLSYRFKILPAIYLMVRQELLLLGLDEDRSSTCFTCGGPSWQRGDCADAIWKGSVDRKHRWGFNQFVRCVSTSLV